MIKIIFICHGNICRSPVAEILAQKLIKENGLEDKIFAYSRAVSNEEDGNDIYPPMKKVLNAHDIKFARHHATKITTSEFNDADYIFYMDSSNYYYLNRLFGNNSKIKHIASFYDGNDIEDPWYTGRFELVFNQINGCVKAIIEHFKSIC